jgi:RNA polymerase sigma-70 factor (ECF subfamily)
MQHVRSDETLMEALARGEIGALGELYLRHGKMVKSALSRFAPELADADVEELCQDVFLALNTSAKRYTEQMKLKAWLFSITVKKARSWRRSHWLRRRLMDLHIGKTVAQALPVLGLPDTRLAHREEAARALDRLSQKQREAVLLQAVDGFTCGEIAEILGVQVGVVWSRIHRARQTLRRGRKAHAADEIWEGES